MLLDKLLWEGEAGDSESGEGGRSFCQAFSWCVHKVNKSLYGKKKVITKNNNDGERSLRHGKFSEQ
jgi:hypothetical protein